VLGLVRLRYSQQLALTLDAALTIFYTHMNSKVPFVLTALCASVGLAQAQSVEVFGVLDVAYLRTTATGSAKATSLSTDSNTSSRLGFRGNEDLGGGMRASFWLEAAHSPDNGSGSGTNVNNQSTGQASSPSGTQGLTFGRRSTVSLAGTSWGEIRLGRDYVPSFNNLTVAMHPFGTNGVGSAGALFYPLAANGTTARTGVRTSNSVGYILPSNLNGFNGHVMYAMGENASGLFNSDDGTHMGFRVGYRNGPWNMAYASGTTKYTTAAKIANDYEQTNFAINYQMGQAKLMFLTNVNKIGATKTQTEMFGTQYNVSTGQVRIASTKLKATGVANDATQWAVGYVHNLSKRTVLFTNYSKVDNAGTGKQFTVGGGNNVTTAGGSSSGYEFGIRHSF
jgi:predicted porin